MTPRPIEPYQEPIKEIHLHAFGDASGKSVSTAVYGVSRQYSGNTQMLIAAKSRLAKRGLTILRLELSSGHMAVNLITNVANCVAKTRPHTSVKLHHVPTDQNPADLGNRGGQQTEMWFDGPQCL